MVDYKPLQAEKTGGTETSTAGRSFTIQRKCRCGAVSPTPVTQKRECSACAAKSAAKSPILDRPNLSRQSDHAALVELPATSMSSAPMPKPLRQRAEATFGSALPNVNFHTDGKAQSYASQLQAKAFTTGNDIYFGSGFYRPDTREGMQLIGHELTHVVQQRRGLARASLRGSADAYEQEADRGGEAFAAGKRFSVSTPQGNIGRFPQRMGAGESAALVGTEDPPYDLDFLGEMADQDELNATMDSLRSLENANQKLVLIPESAIERVGAASAPATSTNIAQSKALTTAKSSQPIDYPIIQRAQVAGCNVPSMTASQIGVAAHMQIGGACGLLHAALPSSSCLGGGHPGFFIPGGATRPDMVIQHQILLDELGEIKPASWLNPHNNLQATAQAQLNRDLISYQTLVGPATTMYSYVFPTTPFVANPQQNLSVWPAIGGSVSNGVYYYRCTSKPKRPRPPTPITVPVPVPVVPPVTQPVTPRIRTPSVNPKVVVGAAATVGVGYLIYRGFRMLPSLLPPFWPTIPANLAVP
ncbi:eCIS core domain-containing protein [Veronia pacifica]|uniref:DUF4157 domain-containing protein n=1 Tax=Veronia pacifica TaxID=1080227 RepID=A0A1C3EEB8_9GAMM|nr:DUF4157 domain-containing protein [Veronia pacifica]ODA31591.1 hypothetical protein A8L45_16430 [Veronia pacifica]